MAHLNIWLSIFSISPHYVSGFNAPETKLPSDDFGAFAFGNEQRFILELYAQGTT